MSADTHVHFLSTSTALLEGAGEGGLLCTNNKDYRDHADMVRMFGEVVEKGKKREYNAYTMGWNYRISPLIAAMVRRQFQAGSARHFTRGRNFR